MKASKIDAQQGNVLLCAILTIAVVSIIGANVLMNCTTRYNVSSSQVRGWKEALYAAESAGDMAFAEIRKTISSPGASPTPAAWTGWTNSGTTHTSAVTTFGQHNLKASAKVDEFSYTGAVWYRIRATGTAPVMGVRRVGMDDRMTGTTRGDSLLRKIDFNYDHFLATYGPNGDRTGQALVQVSNPQISRRIELIASPVTPFGVAIKAAGSFTGLGSAAYIDSYRSTVGSYDPTVRTNPSDPRYVDSRSGSVQINTGIATIAGDIYGNLYTNGGTVTGQTSHIVSPGIIDNNVPFYLGPFYMPDTSTWNYVSPTSPSHPPAYVSGNTAITPPVAGTPLVPNYYLFSSFDNNANLTVNPVIVGGVTQETYVAVHVTGDVGTSSGQGPTITVPNNVHLKFYFDGNFQTKAQNIQNASGVAGNLQFYAISPPDTNPPTVQTVDLNSAGGSTVGFAAVFYAPSANVTVNGAPDITGSVVAHNFYANGNIHWHYDRALDTMGDAVDFHIASYAEDIR